MGAALKFLVLLIFLVWGGAYWLSHSWKNLADSPAPLVSTTQAVKATPVLAKTSTPPKAPEKIAPPAPKQEAPQPMIQNWDLEGTGLNPSSIAPFLTYSQPKDIVFFDDDGMKRIRPNRVENGARQDDKTLFMASPGAIKKVTDERVKQQEKLDSVLPLPPPNQPELPTLAENAYEIVFFRPGKNDLGETIQPYAPDHLAAIQGPDYLWIPVPIEPGPEQTEKMHRIQSTALPFGYGGELLLKVKGNGYILDEPGADFALFENVMKSRIEQYLELGMVGVSESEDPASFRWYECDPQNDVKKGCFGMALTSSGGDQFDLGELGLHRARYIWIKDLGTEKSKHSQEFPSEGCDLDAVRLIHAHP